MSEETGSETTENVTPKKKRSRKCKNIMAVTVKDDGFSVIPEWPMYITTMERAVKEAKKVMALWAKDPEKSGLTLSDISFFRLLGTLKGKSQVVMSFAVE